MSAPRLDELCPGYSPMATEFRGSPPPMPAIPLTEEEYFGINKHLKPLELSRGYFRTHRLPSPPALAHANDVQEGICNPTYTSVAGRWCDWSPPAHTLCRMQSQQQILPALHQSDKTHNSHKEGLGFWKKGDSGSSKTSGKVHKFKLSFGESASKACTLLSTIVIGALFIANLMVLNVNLLPLIDNGATIVKISASVAGQATSANYATCLSLFDLTANESPMTYPCQTCVSVITSFRGRGSKGLKATHALQFCALADIYKSVDSNSTSSRSLANAGWMRDAQYCHWGGIECNQQSEITALTLSAPTMPPQLPNTFVLLSTLQHLALTEDGKLPGNVLPVTFWQAFPDLRSLQLQSTGIIGELPDDFFRRHPAMDSFSLISNPGISNVMPSSISTASLTEITISGSMIQTASVQAMEISSSLRQVLTSLTLQNAGLSGIAPNLSDFSELELLDLSSNDLTSLSGLPNGSLNIVKLDSNTNLSGSLPQLMCDSNTLKQCNIANTGLSKCGICV